MTDTELAAIRRQHEADEGSWTDEEQAQQGLHAHRAALLAEVDRLRAALAARVGDQEQPR